MFFTLFGFLARGGSPKGLVHNLLMQFFTLGSSKLEVFENEVCHKQTQVWSVLS